MRRQTSEASSAGLSTTEFPATRAGPSFQAPIMAGAFQGRIAPTTPSGVREIMAVTLSPR